MVDLPCFTVHGGGGIFVRGQVCGENFVFQFGVQIFPILRNLGHSTLITPVPRASASFSMESQPRPCSVFCISDELALFKIWACQSFAHLIVHKEPRVSGVEVCCV